MPSAKALACVVLGAPSFTLKRMSTELLALTDCTATVTVTIA